MGDKPLIKVLLVEDDPEDATLLADAVKAGGPTIDLRIVGDGQKAIDYVRNVGPYAGMPRPDLILLDLHLPKKGGLEVLKEIKRDERLRVIPVITLTSSADSSDIWDAYAAGANVYVAKPVGLAALVDLVRLIADFWCVARLPPQGP